MRGVCFSAKLTLFYLGVQRGEEQVLQNGAVVGIAVLTVVVLQQVAHILLLKQFLGDQSLLLQKPDEQ